MTATMWTDFRMALRALARRPGSAAPAVLLLALATGVNLGMAFLGVRGVLSPPALVPQPERVLALGFDAGEGAWMTTTSFAALTSIAADVPAVGAAAGWFRGSSIAVVAGEPREVEVVSVAGDYFGVLAVAPRIGRTLDPGGAEAAAVLSADFWHSAFGGRPDVLGQRLAVGGVEYTIAGVMPSGFTGHAPDRVDAWIPIAAAMQGKPGWQNDPFRNVVSVLVRLAPGGSAAALRDQSSLALARGVTTRPLSGSLAATAVERRLVAAVAGLSALVLLIALANTATLLLVRGARRRTDFAIRAAIGASRSRLVAQAVWEGAILAAAAGASAFVLARWTEEAMRRLLLPALAPRVLVEPWMIGAALAAAALAGGVAAAAGIAHIPRTADVRDLRGGRYRRSISQRVLLAGQVAVVVVLLGGAGLFGRSLHSLRTQSFGFSIENVLLVGFTPGVQDVRDRDALFLAAVDRVRALPGVTAATVVQSAPFGSFHVPPISVPGRAEPPAIGRQLPYLIAATPDLFDVAGIELLEGRRFTEADDRGAPVVIVNASMAATVWPGESAIGKCIRIGFDPDFDPLVADGPPMPSSRLPCREVVGVARDFRQRSVLPAPNEDRLMQYYVPFSQVPPPPGAVDPGPRVSGLLVRTEGDPRSLVRAIRTAVTAGRTDLPVLNVRPYLDIFDRGVRPWRVGLALLGMFAALAVIVAAVGLYAAFAQAVAQRRRELAIRVAVGAARAAIARMILRDAAAIAVVGAAAGIGLTIAGGRAVVSLLYGTSPADPIVLGAIALAALAIAVAATAIPARAAARTDPNELLRAE
jgi:predicted permease